MDDAPSEQADESGGGMASLQVAQAHLSTLLGQLANLESKAMFLAAVNVAVFGIFFGAVVALEWSWWAIAPPSTTALVAAALAWVAIRPTAVKQHPAPEELLAFNAAGRSDDELAWTYVRSIAAATEWLADPIATKTRIVVWTAIITFAQASIVAVSAVIWG